MAVTSAAEQNIWTESDAADSNTAACAALRNSQELGLQLRFAAEKGRVVEVRKLLSSGAPVLRDAVSTRENDPLKMDKRSLQVLRHYSCMSWQTRI